MTAAAKIYLFSSSLVRYMVGLHLLNVGSPFNPVLIRDTCNEGLNSGVNKYIHRIGTRNWD